MRTRNKPLFLLIACCFCVCFTSWPTLSVAAQSDNPTITNLVQNGSFEQTAESKPLYWNIDGDKGVEQNLSLGVGVTGGHAARLQCDSFTRYTRKSYATLTQTGKMNLRKGKWYRFSCWARHQGMTAAMVTAELQTAAQKGNYWKTTLLFYQIPLKQQWQYYERYFQAGYVGQGDAELMFYFDFTGTLWLDEVEIVPADEPFPEYTNRIPLINTNNLLPNAGFECGVDGWSSLGKSHGWIGGLSGLYGEIQEGDAWEGNKCLRIELGPGKTPVTSFNFFEVNSIVQHAPLVANMGWAEVQPDHQYTLSAYMRADQDGIPVKMLIRFAEPLGGTDDVSSSITQNKVAFKSGQTLLTTKWQRYSITVTANRRYALVAVGPDMTAMPDKKATVWIDAIQLRESERLSEFQPRLPVEMGINTDKYGNVFNTGEPIAITFSAVNSTFLNTSLDIHLSIEDYFDKIVYDDVRRLEIPANNNNEYIWPLPLDKGYYNLSVSWESCGQKNVQRIPIAIIDPYSHADSVFGVNHAPGTNNNCRQLCKAGVVWAREWALKWQHIEPKPGQFKFEPEDQHINRVLGTGMKMVQQLPPFPSAEWNSTAPPELTEKFPGYANLYGRMAYPPRDPDIFARFVEQVANHYRHQDIIWEYLNEPFYTTYSFPNTQQLDAASESLPGANFTVQDYISLLKIMYTSVKKADPKAKVIGGLGGRPDLLTREFFHGGGLDYVDYFNLHIYPGLRRPEGYIQQMSEMLAEMDKSSSGRRPIWMTEYAYFSTDALPWLPYIVGPGPWSANRLLCDEKQGGDYLVRYAVIMLAHGVEKIFYHNGAGVSCEINNALAEMESWMLLYAGVPRKTYVVQSVLSNMLGPAPRFVGLWKKPSIINGQSTDEVYGYAFQCGHRAVLIAWAPNPESIPVSWTVRPPDTVQAYNVVGVSVEPNSIELGESPIYLISEKINAHDLAEKSTLHFCYVRGKLKEGRK